MKVYIKNPWKEILIWGFVFQVLYICLLRFIGSK